MVRYIALYDEVYGDQKWWVADSLSSLEKDIASSHSEDQIDLDEVEVYEVFTNSRFRVEGGVRIQQVAGVSQSPTQKGGRC